MKKLTLSALAIAFAFTLIQCSPKTAKPSSDKKSDNPTPVVMLNPAVEEIKKNYTTDQIAEGKTIYDSKCGKCHELFSPKSETVKKWDTHILPEMNQKAKLSDEQAKLVRAYVLINAKP